MKKNSQSLSCLKSLLEEKLQKQRILSDKLSIQKDNYKTKPTKPNLKKCHKTQRALTQLQSEIKSLKEQAECKIKNKETHKWRCSICGAVVSQRTDHLKLVHNLLKRGKELRTYFTNPNDHCPLACPNIGLQSRPYTGWKEIKPHLKNTPKCGEIVNGAPKVRILYNATEKDRRKH